MLSVLHVLTLSLSIAVLIALGWLWWLVSRTPPSHS